MAKRHHHKQRHGLKNAGVDPVMLVDALKQRATDVAEDQKHHQLGRWQPGKKKWGKASQQAWCPKCDSVVIVMPYGSQLLKGSSHPAMTGDALFEYCSVLSFE